MGFDLDRFTEGLPDHLICPVCLGRLRFYESVCVRAGEGCGWKGSVSDVKRHEDQECDRRLAHCSLCGAVCRLDQGAAHHAVCPMVWLACPICGKGLRPVSL
ncbi:hypothetical protein JCM8547_002149 [Rhodosporidiobolus lusitaniae]